MELSNMEANGQRAKENGVFKHGRNRFRERRKMEFLNIDGIDFGSKGKWRDYTWKE